MATPTHLVVVEDDHALVSRQLEIELHGGEAAARGLRETSQGVFDLGLGGDLGVIPLGVATMFIPQPRWPIWSGETRGR